MAEKPVFDIETVDYETERHVFDMWRWINGKMAEMEEKEGFDRIYHERKGENVKKLIEEAIPVAHLGLSFFDQGDEIYIRCLTGNQPYDATLRITGFRSFDIEVEVTVAEPKDAYLRRESLSRHGTAWTTGKIEKIGGKIVSEPEMIDVDEECDKWVDLALNGAMEKVRRGSYGPKTAILVRVDKCPPLPIQYRAELDYKTREELGKQKNKVYGIYYFHAWGCLVDAVRENRGW